MTKRSQRRLAVLTPLIALLGTVAVVEAIVAPLGVFVPAEFRDRQATLFGLFEPDPKLGFRARANLRDFELSWMQNSLRARYNTDEYGFRNAGRNYDDSTIFFIGDSFTWGSWRPREQTFPDLVGSHTGMPVANLAQQSYYIEQYEKVAHLLFEGLLRSDRPRYVALCIFANDLTSPVTDDDLADFYARFGWDEYREYPIHKRLFVYHAAQFIGTVAGNLAVLAGLSPPAPPSHLDRRVTQDGVELYRQLGAHPHYFSLSYNTHTEEVFARLLRYIMDRKATPLVFLLPSKESAYQHDYRRLFPDDYLEIEETGYQRLCDIAAAMEVSCTDLTPAFRSATRNTAVYFQRDPHWNREGHRLAATEIVSSSAFNEIPE